MVYAALAALIPLAYTTATNALPVDPPSAPRYDNSGRGLVRRQRGGRWTTSARCYTDNINARTLTGIHLVYESMTTEACLDFCHSNGYSYAGTEWSKECYCDNDFRNGGEPVDDGCDMPCSGAPDETCGGGNRLSVYEYIGGQSPSEPNNPGWSAQGCYTDSIANRALPNQVYVDGGMTVDKCTSRCFSLGYPLAGVEYANECFCGGAIGSSPADGGCDMPCAGNANEICGGGNRLNVYQYTGASALPSIGDWVLDGETGCYTDTVANRALGLRVYVDGAMTVSKCTEKCFSLNYGYAGLEYADECYCSHEIGSSGVPTSDGCTMSCSGDMSAICGGSDRLTVYKYQGTDLAPAPTVLESYNSFRSQGCYTDSVHARIMTPVAVEGSMTVEKCIDASVASGYTVAAVEFGAECYGSATLPAESFKATENCNMPCAGDSTHLCGGADRLNVYQYQAPVTTTPTVPATETSTSTSSVSTSSSTPSATWVYQGCADINWNSDIFDELSSLSQSQLPQITVQTCLDHCSSLGSEAAMTTGPWCLCNPTQISGLRYNEERCSYVCPGDNTQICGGVTAASVYYKTYPAITSSGSETQSSTSTDVSVSTSLPTTTAAPEESPLPVNLGCFVYGSQSVAGKSVFNAAQYRYLQQASATECVAYCGALGSDIALIANTDCVCIPSSRLNDLNTNGGGCDYSCTAAGEESLLCGNGDEFAYSVYKPSPSNGATTTMRSTSQTIPMPSPTTF